MNIRPYLAAGALAAIAAYVAPAASAQVYFDRASFENALGGVIFTEDFESAPVGLLAPGSTALGQVVLTIDGGDGTEPRIRDFGSVNGSREFVGDIDADGATFNRFDFAAPIRGFGGDFLSTTTGDRLTVEVAGTTYLFRDLFLFPPGSGFIGIVSDTPFSSITFRSENLTSFGEAYTLDDLSFGAGRTAVIPEPSEYAAMGLAGFALCGLMVRARRKASRAA